MKTSEQFISIEQRITELAPWQAFAFGLAMSERLYPNYALFSEVSNSGDAKLLRNILNSCWDSIISIGAKIDFDKLLNKAESLIPDPADHDNFGVIPAIDASMCITASIELLQENCAGEEVLVPSRLSRNTIEAYIDAADLSDDDANATWCAEYAFQAQLLDMLNDLARYDKELIRHYKMFAQNGGISNIGIML